MFPALLPAIASTALSLFSSPTAKAPSVPKQTQYSFGVLKSDKGKTTKAAPAAGTDWQKMYNDALASLRAAQTPQPRFINYDIGGSWAKARELATNAVSPIYQQKMTDFVNRQQVELGRKQEDVVSQKQSLDQVLSRFLEDTGTSRTRAQEDTTANVSDIEEAQAFSERMGGLSFDSASRALAEGLGAAGTADSGLGRGQVTESIQNRNLMSNEQVRQMENKVEAQNTLMTRTFADLEKGETRKTEDTTSAKAKVDLDLERFIGDQAFEKDQKTKQLALEKEADIARQSLSYQDQIVDQWIQSLSGKGYTAQEIANAASMYR